MGASDFMSDTKTPVMKNNENARSDPEGGMAAAFDPPPRSENPSTTRSLALPLPEELFKYLSWKKLESVLSSISRCFNLTKATTRQKALVLLCVAGAILDPLFFYIPMIIGASKCMKYDRKLAAVAISLRSLADVLHFLLWRRYYSEKWKGERPNSAEIAPAAAAAAASTTTSSEEKKEISQGNPNSMSPRNSKATDLLIEILSIFPLPQAVTLTILNIQGSLGSQQAVMLLKFSVLNQLIIRMFWVIPSFQEATTNSFTLLKNRSWIGAGFNLLLFVIASHVLGAFWYLLSVGRMMDCWKSACKRRGGCNIDSLYCGGPMDNKSYLDNYCSIRTGSHSSTYNFGIYQSALEANIVGSIRFPLKLSYCFWWGLRNLSSLGQNLATSAYEWEICFSICISILGLILFSLFIGNMQAYFQYQTKEDLKNMKGKMDKSRNKQWELSKWQLFEWLPPNLKQDIKSCMEDNWLETTEVDLQTTLNNLPKDLGGKVKHSIFSELRTKVKLFKAFNNQAIARVKPEVFAEGSLVFSKDHPIDKMVFILSGKLTKQTGTDGSKPQELLMWDSFGEELLEDIVSGSSTTQLSIQSPLSTADIKTCTKVEAFILDTSDLQYLINQPKVPIEDIKRFIGKLKKLPLRPSKRKRGGNVSQLQNKQDNL